MPDTRLHIWQAHQSMPCIINFIRHYHLAKKAFAVWPVAVFVVAQTLHLSQLECQKTFQ